MTKKETIYFKNRHLNTAGKALYADAMVLESVDFLPASMVEHVEKCQFCRLAVIDASIVAEEGMSVASLKTHPFFGQTVLEKLREVLKKKITNSVKNWKNELEELIRVLSDEGIDRRIGQLAVRSEGTTRKFSVLRPEYQAVCTDNIVFIFSQAIPENTRLELRNHAGIAVFSDFLPVGSTTFELAIHSPKVFPTDLYYWNIQLSTGAVLLGKLLIYAENG